MPVLLDTGIFLGNLNAADPWHKRSQAILRELRTGRHGNVMSTDLVAVEAMNFLVRRPADRLLSERMWSDYLRATPVRWLATTPDVLREAGRIHLQHYARGLSLTDASIVAHAQALGAKVATLDGDFDGLVPTIGR